MAGLLLGHPIDFPFPVPTLRPGECRLAGAGRGLQIYLGIFSPYLKVPRTA